LLETPVSLDEILNAISGDTTDARDAVKTTIDRLISEICVQTIEISETRVGPRRVQAPTPYAPPIIDIFHDLQELIVVDPVHEVDEIDGWPHRPPPFRVE